MLLLELQRIKEIDTWKFSISFQQSVPIIVSPALQDFSKSQLSHVV